MVEPSAVQPVIIVVGLGGEPGAPGGPAARGVQHAAVAQHGGTQRRQGTPHEPRHLVTTRETRWKTLLKTFSGNGFWRCALWSNRITFCAGPYLPMSDNLSVCCLLKWLYEWRYQWGSTLEDRGTDSMAADSRRLDNGHILTPLFFKPQVSTFCRNTAPGGIPISTEFNQLYFTQDNNNKRLFSCLN